MTVMSNGFIASTNDLFRLLSNSALSDEEVVKIFLSTNIPYEILSPNQQLSVFAEGFGEVAGLIIRALINTPLDKFRNIIQELPPVGEIRVSDVPQFSNMATAMYYIPKVLYDNNESYTYGELGMLIHSCKSEVAAKKYGENQAKLTISLGLATQVLKDGKAAVAKSIFTDQFCKLEQDQKNDLLQKLCYRIHLVRKVVQYDNWRDALDSELSFLSESMLKRRKHNCVDLICFALNE